MTWTRAERVFFGTAYVVIGGFILTLMGGLLHLCGVPVGIPELVALAGFVVTVGCIPCLLVSGVLIVRDLNRWEADYEERRRAMESRREAR